MSKPCEMLLDMSNKLPSDSCDLRSDLAWTEEAIEANLRSLNWQGNYAVRGGSGRPPLHLEWERGTSGLELRENDLLDLTLPSWHFFMLPICKIDD